MLEYDIFLGELSNFAILPQKLDVVSLGIKICKEIILNELFRQHRIAPGGRGGGVRGLADAQAEEIRLLRQLLLLRVQLRAAGEKTMKKTSRRLEKRRTAHCFRNVFHFMRLSKPPFAGIIRV